MVAKQQHVSIVQEIECTCKISMVHHTHAKAISSGFSNFCYSKIKEIKSI